MNSKEKTHTAIEAVSGELAALRSRQEAAKKRLVEIGGQVQALREATLSLDDFLSYLAMFIASRGRSYGSSIMLKEWLRPNRGSGFDHHVPVYQKPWSDFESEDGDIREYAISFPDHSALVKASSGFDAWCFFATELVTKNLAEQLKAEARTKWPQSSAPTVEQRRALLEQLEQERESVEEEQQIVAQSISEISRMLGV